MNCAYLHGELRTLLINPETSVPEGIVHIEPSDIESPNGRPVGLYNGIKVEVCVDLEAYKTGRVPINSLLTASHYDMVTSGGGHRIDTVVGLELFPEIKALFEKLLKSEPEEETE